MSFYLKKGLFLKNLSLDFRFFNSVAEWRGDNNTDKCLDTCFLYTRCQEGIRQRSYV